ncbi:protein of unknown function (DUF4149) domain containing protein [Hyaloscypha variabilis]|uniref:TMEM205-like domain-containing protein n=1 Tax=Hyaloscypha variabilis (strain UAMH 11265 / GT02V1 / F) TaxID=1149755 RepID=A0A2J6RDB1_HYAVF|nr:hypothetical protein L207DRAFT_586206 [Hyaloscypha variabilis F]
MPDLSLFKSPAPYHIISYGTLLGTEFFQTFVGGIVSYQALPRAGFSQLQQKLMPVYFSLQTALPAVLALTYPGSKILGLQSGLQGVLADRWGALVPVTTIFITGLANWAYFGPATTRVMRERKHQETKDGKKYHDPGPHSTKMQQLNSSFNTMHSLSALLNLAGYVSTCFYGFSLASRIQ